MLGGLQAIIQQLCFQALVTTYTVIPLWQDQPVGGLMEMWSYISGAHKVKVQ